MTPPFHDDMSVETQLAVINTKLDLLIQNRTDHESRLRALEQFRWVLVGVAIAASAASGTITALVVR